MALFITLTMVLSILCILRGGDMWIIDLKRGEALVVPAILVHATVVLRYQDRNASVRDS
jgi:hypothetical protein